MTWNMQCVLAVLWVSISSDGVLATGTITDQECPQGRTVNVRVVSFNVQQGKVATAQEIGMMLRRIQPDVVGLSEVPEGDWVQKVGTVAGLTYSYVGSISSAHHKDKYKAIISRSPLSDRQEFELLSGDSWKPASAVKAITRVKGVEFSIYSLHIARSKGKNGQAYEFTSRVLPLENGPRVILTGDFNNEVKQSGLKNIIKAGFQPVWFDVDTNFRKVSSVAKKSKIGIIDHIFYNKKSNAKALIAGVINLPEPLSDHKPVVADIQFPVLCP